MAWPTLQEYNEAIQNPQIAFNDPELKAGKPEIDKWRLPRVRTGQFACVYRMKCANRDWAVRCFSQEVKDQQARYKAIDEYISPLNIPNIVEFDYLAKGILVKGQWYPILRMEWVKGELISDYVEHNLRNSYALHQLAVRWVEMLKVLQANSIGHGDLQHGNVLVVGDTLKLVDYDGMFVPVLRGQLSHEIGHPNYQHPNRTENDFGLYIDNFSAWVIYVSLVALSIDPSLWARTKAGDECFLFRKADFKQPLLSPALGLLTGHPDPNIRNLATLFRSMLFFPPQQVPSLDGQIPLIIQTDTISSSNQAGWWQDHSKTNVKPIPGKSETLPNKQDRLPAASWILDFLNPPIAQYFRKPFIALRLYAISSVIIPLVFLGVAVPFISSPIVAGDSMYLDVIIGFMRVLTFSIFGYVNIMILVWRYLHEPSVISRQNLSVRVKKARELMESLEKSLAISVHNKDIIKNDENKRRKELDSALSRLQDQEHKELDNVQAALKIINVSIESRRRNFDQYEKGALGKLNETIGSRLNSLNQQIALLIKAESDEILRELAKIQNGYKEDYLKRQPISRAKIPGLRYASRSSLEAALFAHGIFTANDISYYRVDAVPGFGPKRTQALVSWQNNLVREATRLMPSVLNPNMKNAIRIRYESQKKPLEILRISEQGKYNMEERAIRDRSRSTKRSLDLEQSTAQTESNRKVQDISKRFAQEYLKPTEAINHLAAEFSSKLREADEQSKMIRQKIFTASWQNAKIHHEYLAYRNISFFKYLGVVYLGVHIK
jgi:hypothetical protein